MGTVVNVLLEGSWGLLVVVMSEMSSLRPLKVLPEVVAREVVVLIALTKVLLPLCVPRRPPHERVSISGTSSKSIVPCRSILALEVSLRCPLNTISVV